LLLLSAPLSAPPAQELTSSAPEETSEQPSPPPLKLLQSAEDWLKIIEDSLIEQGKPVESLSTDLPALYQRSLELERSVKELWELSGRLGESLKKLEAKLKTINDVENFKNIALGTLTALIIVETVTVLLIIH
jgi:hypothetical protein